MANLAEFGLKDVKPGGNFDPIPPGEYRAIVTKTELKPTKDGTGKRLNIQLQITGGQHQNRVLFDGLNVVNKSEQAQSIGRAQLKSLCVAVNVPDASDSAQLHNKPLMIKVGIRKGQDGTDQNTIKGYKACLPAAPQKVPAPTAQSDEPNMVAQAFEELEAAPKTKNNPFAKKS